MLKRIVFIVFLLTLNVTYCQSNYHIISLLPIEQEDAVEHVNFYVSKVIDNRSYKDNIGIAQKGVFNKKVLSVFENPFEDELMAYLNIVFPSSTTMQPITVRINQLLISEHTGALKETGKATVSLDILVFKNNGYHFMGSFSAYSESNGVDVTGKHDDRIRQVLKDCLLQFNLSDTKTIDNRVVSLVNTSYPILLSEDLKNGFFTSFSELYANMPFEDSLIKFKNSKQGSNKLFLEDRDHKRALYYAFSNGENIYINASNYSGEKHFVKTEFVDNYLLFNDTFVNQDKVMGMSFAFGVLGVLASNEQTHVLLNLLNGQYHKIDSYKIRLLLKNDYPVLYDKIKKNPNDITLLKSILTNLLKSDRKEGIKQILESS